MTFWQDFLRFDGIGESRMRIVIAAVLFSLTSEISVAGEPVPFVGCVENVQGDIRPAPNGFPKMVEASARQANLLAYYKAELGPGILGPRGWSCVGVAGSNGQSLFLTPTANDPTFLYSNKFDGFVGPAIQLSVSSGDTSGRFEVAKIVARAFPMHRDYAQKIIAEGLMPPDKFPFGSYPKDNLRYVNDHVVEFRTPESLEGLGTQSRLKAGGGSIDGVAMFDPNDPALAMLTMRLPPNLRELVPLITHQIEQDGFNQQ